MEQNAEFIRVYLSSLIRAHERDIICFATDKNRFVYVNSYGVNHNKIKIGEKFFIKGFIEKCILEKKPIVSSFEYKEYGEIINSCIWPIIKGGDIKGTFGIILPNYYPAKDIVELWAESSFDRASFTIITTDKTIYRFHLPAWYKFKRIQSVTNKRICRKIKSASVNSPVEANKI
ncbi:MAG: hypothetical protein HPY50_05165 [Firmicutes bacterium]|nr:hypothetical protein [Bacillota bacterium]